MFIRKLKNRSGSVSIQIITKTHGKYKVLKSIGSATTQQKIDKLISFANEELEKI